MNSLHPLYNYTGSTGLYYDDSLLSSNVYNQVITNYISSNILSDVIKPYISSNVLTNILYNTSNSLVKDIFNTSNLIEEGINQITELLGDSVIPASTITGAIVANDIITTANTGAIGVNTIAISGLTATTVANSASIVSLSASKTNTSDFNHGNIGYKAFTDTNGINTSLWALYDTNIFQDLLVPFSQNYYCSLKEPYLSLPTNHTNLNNDYNTFKNTTIPATYISSNVIRILLNDSDNKNINTYISSNVIRTLIDYNNNTNTNIYISSNVLPDILSSYTSSNVIRTLIDYNNNTNTNTYISSNVLPNILSFYLSNDYFTDVISGYLPLSGGSLSGNLSAPNLQEAGVNLSSKYVRITNFNSLATTIPYINTLNIADYPSQDPSFGTNYFNVGRRNIYYSDMQVGMSLGGVSYGGGAFYIIKGTELVTANIGIVNSLSKIELKYGDTIITSPSTIIQSPNITLNGKISGDNLITRGAKFFTCTIKKWLPLGFNGSSAYVDIYILDLTTLTNVFNNSRLFNITLFPEQSFGYSTEADRFIINHKIFMNASSGFINANSFTGTNQLYVKNDMSDNGALINGLVYIDLNKIMFKCGDTSKGLKWYYIIEDLFA